MPRRRSIPGLVCMLVAFAPIPLAHAEDSVRVIPVTEPSPGTPTCEEFYDKWEMPGVPPVILAMGGLGREALAATDCMKKNDVAMACKHWQGILAVINRVGPPLDESRGDVEQLMQEHKCAEGTDPAPIPGADLAPDSQASPDTDSVPEQDPSSGSDPQTGPGSPE